MEKAGVYILNSLKSNSYYIGSTNDIKRRLLQHNKGFVKTTKNIRPLIVATFISCENFTVAKSAEYRLKKYKRRDIIEKVVQDRIFPWDYMRA